MTGARMPAEFAAHERTLMAWPCRRELWGIELPAACDEYAAVGNAIAAFEPLTMVCQSEEDAAVARAALTAAVEVVVAPIDDSWFRDSGPCFVLAADGTRRAVHFGFNAWGEKFHAYTRDQAIGRWLGEHVGDPVDEAPMVLEGGSIAVDGAGVLLTTRQCLLNPNRNPGLDQEQIEEILRDHLGVSTIVWLDQGLAEDRDTDGHVDMIAAFTGPGALMLQSAPPGDVNHETMAHNAQIARDAGLTVTEFEPLARIEVAGDPTGLSYLNGYVINGAVVVPTAGIDADAEALALYAAAFPGREIVGVGARTIAYGGGGPHCITQQVPACA